ncbi:MAG: serine hydrolase domain-containing protein [Pseudohongiellaceae bacterium]
MITRITLLLRVVFLSLVFGLAGAVAACSDSQGSSSFPVGASSINRVDAGAFGIDQTEIESIREKMQAAVDEGSLAGALLLVGNGDGVGVLETVGSRAPDSTDPVNAETIFRIYSMTKPIVSVAIMSMVEDGLIGLDDPLEKYIPEFANLQVMNPTTAAVSSAENSITIENLLTHESGLIQAIFSPNSELGKQYRSQLSGDMLLADFAAKLGGLPVHFEPGSAWHYGHSTDILGRVLEVAGESTLDVVLQERIFDPLGMDETSFWVPEEKAGRLAQPIHGIMMSDNTVPRQMLSGGGGLNSTTEDYVRFAEMLLNGGVYRGQRIIEEDTLDLMLEKRIGDTVDRTAFFFGTTGDWGLGFHLQPTTDDPNGPHNFGWRGIGGTIFVVDRENDFYMVYMEQKWGGPAAAFDNNAAQRVVYEAIEN